MAETEAPPPLPKSQPSFGRRHSTIIKLLGVGAHVLVLLIPVAITGVLRDRLARGLTRKSWATAGGGERGKHQELFHKIKRAHRHGQRLAPAIG